MNLSSFVSDAVISTKIASRRLSPITARHVTGGWSHDGIRQIKSEFGSRFVFLVHTFLHSLASFVWLAFISEANRPVNANNAKHCGFPFGLRRCWCLTTGSGLSLILNVFMSFLCNFCQSVKVLKMDVVTNQSEFISVQCVDVEDINGPVYTWY